MRRGDGTVVHQVGDRTPVVTPARGYHLDELERALPKAAPTPMPALARWAGMSIAGRIDAVRSALRGDWSWYMAHLRGIGATTGDIVEAVVILVDRGDEEVMAWVERVSDVDADQRVRWEQGLRPWLLRVVERV